MPMSHYSKSGMDPCLTLVLIMYIIAIALDKGHVVDVKS